MGDTTSDAKRAYEVTVATDASAYDAGDVVSGTVTVNRVGAMKAKVPFVRLRFTKFPRSFSNRFAPARTAFPSTAPSTISCTNNPRIGTSLYCAWCFFFKCASITPAHASRTHVIHHCFLRSYLAPTAEATTLPRRITPHGNSDLCRAVVHRPSIPNQFRVSHASSYFWTYTDRACVEQSNKT